jgi:hypothetical protein
MRRKINIKDKVSEELINSKYKFGKLLGQGSSASVYEAEHRRTGRAQHHARRRLLRTGALPSTPRLRCPLPA